MHDVDDGMTAASLRADSAIVPIHPIKCRTVAATGGLAEDSQLTLRVAFSPIYGQRRRPDHDEANKTHVHFGRRDGAYGRRTHRG